MRGQTTNLRTRVGPVIATLTVCCLIVASCGADAGSASGSGAGAGSGTGGEMPSATVSSTVSSPDSAAAEPEITAGTTSTTSSSTTTTSTPPPTPIPPSTTTPSTSTSAPPAATPPMIATHAVFDSLAAGNAAASITVTRDGVPIVQRASGTTVDGAPATSSAPMVVASVSKLLTATALARLEQRGLVALDEPMPWHLIGITPHPAWNDVTVRELLDHTSGMPVVRSTWFVGEDICWTYLPSLVSGPPAPHRGKWTYSNGNYCALGLLVGALSWMPLDEAIRQLVLDPTRTGGDIHTSLDGERPGDIRYALGLGRLARLGGAGSLIVSTDAIAAALASVTVDDRRVLSWPAVMNDQYGWGHTGTIDGAKACAWVLDDGRTAVAATVAGNRPATGGSVCDMVVPAVASDLSLPIRGTPERTPP